MTLALTQNAPHAGSSGGLSVGRYVSMFRRRPLVIVSVFLVVFALVAGLNLSQPKQYTATAQVQVDLAQKSAADLLPTTAFDNGLADASKLETEISIMQSGVVAESVARVLESSPAGPVEPPRAPGLMEMIKDGIGGIANLLPHKAPKPSLVSPLTAKAQALQSGLKVARGGGSYVIAVSYTARDPVTAANMANLFVSQYQLHKNQRNVTENQQASTFLNATLEDLTKQVVAADSAVAQYRQQHGLQQAGNSTMNEQTISAVGQQVVAARADQVQAESKYNAAKAQMAEGRNGEDVTEALSSPVISQLRSQRVAVTQKLADLRNKYGDKHPDVLAATQQLNDVDAQIQSEVGRIVSSLASQAKAAQARTQSLQSSLDRATGALSANEQASVQLNELLRNQEVARTTYEQYLGRYKQTTAQEDIPQNNSRVITAATPPAAPSAPNVPKSVVLALAAGLVGSLGVMIGMEALQGGFNSLSEAEDMLGVPGLASIPSLDTTLTSRARRTRLPTLYVAERPLSVFAESFRTLRTALLSLSVDGRPVKIIAITSAVPGEGKTTTSVCLARVAAIGSARTLIVDCDLRRRSLDDVLGRQAEVGLIEVLDGAVTLDEALVADPQSGAFFLPLSANPQPERDIFSTEAMDKFLEEVRERFDLVLLDAAPVLFLADARSLAQKADATLLLTRWRETPKGAANDALRELAAVGANIAGVALTQVDIRQDRQSQYGRSSYYQKYRGYFKD